MKKILVVVLLFLWSTVSESRSLYRPVDPKIPVLNARWVDGSTVHTLKKYHLEEYALFQLFDKKYPRGKLFIRKTHDAFNSCF